MKQLFRFISAFVTFLLYVQLAYSGDIDNARKYFYSGNYKEAIIHYKNSLKTTGIQKPEINYRIGLCYFMLGDFVKAPEYWNDAKSEDAAIFKAKTFRMPSGSMIPTLLIGDLVIADMEYYSYNNIKRNDVVVLLSPKDKKTQYFKRVIALPGEKVEIRNKQLFINGKQLDTNKAVFNDPGLVPASKNTRDNFGPVTISSGAYFVLGDNRDYSFDSRHFGAVEKQLILGKALVIYGSISSKDSTDHNPNRTGIVIK
jgi:signal peptidase I